MQKFCRKCGRKLDEKTGLCPNCDKSVSRHEKRMIEKERKKELKKQKKAEKWAKLTIGQKIKKVCLRILVAVLILLLLTGGAMGALTYFDVVDIPVFNEIFDFFGISESETSDDDNTDATNSSYEENSTEMEELKKEIEKAISELENAQIDVDADAYFQNNSSIVSEIEVNDSDKVHTETEVYNDFVGRGFVENPIETDYSMNGDYFESEAISNTSSTKHPYYQTSYITSNGDIWIIIEINGAVMANPVSYNLQSGSNVQVIISETETVTSYDSQTNKFYETIPNESELIVKTIGSIDAETLENLTFGDIDEL